MIIYKCREGIYVPWKRGNMENKILVETSARHVHVTQELLEILFGKGHILGIKKMLSQPGQFVSNDKVQVFGPDKKDPTKLGEPLSFSILGPVRDHNQVEVSFTDARTLNIKGVVRESGDIKGTPGCVIKGTVGEATLKEGVIVAKRHIHMTPADAEAFGVKNGDLIKLHVNTSAGRELVFGDTVIRVSPKFSLAAHIDTDESNAAAAGGLVYGEIVK